MTPSVITRDLSDHVLTLTIDRPRALNAIDARVHHELGTALAAADADHAVRAVVLTGTGRAFSAGADLKAQHEGRSVFSSHPGEAAWGLGGLVRHHLSVPVIAAVNGIALGGGTELVLACDLAIAAETAIFGLPEVRHGLIAGAGGPFRLRDQLPPKIAMEMMLTGASFDAPTALRWGLVNRVVPPESLAREARRLALSIAAQSPFAVRATKMLARGLVAGEPEHERVAWESTEVWAERIRDHEDAREGLAAFVDGREPIWGKA